MNDAVAAQLEVPWRTNGLLGQAAFFRPHVHRPRRVLRAAALVRQSTCEGIVTGVAAIVLAEYLIGARRWFFTGVEAALWIGGVFALISELPSSGKPEAMLVLAAACAHRRRARAQSALRRAGRDLRHALLRKALRPRRVVRAGSSPSAPASRCCAPGAVPPPRCSGSPSPSGHADRRPLHSRRGLARHHHRCSTPIFGIIALCLAIAKRHHAFFLAAMIALAIAGADFAEQLTAPEEAKLALAGALLLIIAFAVSRTLRGRTHGFVLTPIQLTPFDDAAEIGATLALQPSTPTPVQQPAPASGGGNSAEPAPAAITEPTVSPTRKIVPRATLCVHSALNTTISCASGRPLPTFPQISDSAWFSPFFVRLSPPLLSENARKS